jgi:predicted nucleic acid-binding protein
LANEPVLVDTSCWIEYFNRPGAEVATAVEAMVRDDRAALTGIVLVELLQGARTERELSEVHAALGAVVWIEATRETYARAGRLAFELRRKGITVPITDCVIAAASESAGGCVLTLDAHFQEISGIVDLTVLPER